MAVTSSFQRVTSSYIRFKISGVATSAKCTCQYKTSTGSWTSPAGPYTGSSSYTYDVWSNNVTMYCRWMVQTGSGTSTKVNYYPTSTGSEVGPWSETKYTLSYAPNGGSSTPTGGSYASGTSVTLASAISRNSSTGSTSYTVYFNGNGGTAGSTSKSSSVTTTTTYTFAGWTYSGTTYSAGASFTMPSSNVTMTASWSSSTSYTPSAITLPSATRTGYAFLGWYTASTGGTYIGGSGSSYTPQSGGTLYAHWAYYYDLDYAPNGGSSTPTGGTYYEGQSVTLAAAISRNTTTGSTSYRTNFNGNGGTAGSSYIDAGVLLTYSYSFNGWAYGGSLYAGGTSFTMPGSDVTMTANWKTTTTPTVTSITLPTATRDGYSLNGWYTAATGGTLVGKAGASYTPSASGGTLYAHWTQVYTLTYDPNGGTSTPTGGSYASGTSVTLAAAISRNTTTGSTTYTTYFDGNGGTAGSSSIDVGVLLTYSYAFNGWAYGTSLYAGGASFAMPSSNVTMTANWKTTTTPSPTSLTLPTATRDGYSLNGWYTAATGGTLVGKAGASYTPSASGGTLYAHWTQVYTLTYDPNGGTSTPTGGSYASGTSVTLAAAISHNNTTDSTTYTTYFDGNGGTAGSSSIDVGVLLTKSYTFHGWAYGTSLYDAGASFTMPASNVTMTANWTTTTTPSPTSLTLPSATRTNYTFDGWYTAATGGTYIGTSGETYKPSSDGGTLYAHWTQSMTYSFYVYYYTTDAETPYSTQSATGQSEDTYQFTIIAAPTVSGYKFKKWYGDDVRGTAHTYTAGVDYFFGGNATTGDYTSVSVSGNVTTYTKKIYADLKAMLGKVYWTGSESNDATNIVSGNDVGSFIDHDIWNRALARVRTIDSSAVVTDQNQNDPIMAYYFNQLATAIGSLPGAGSVPSTKNGGDPIHASDFHGSGSIKQALNDAIDNYNSNL